MFNLKQNAYDECSFMEICGDSVVHVLCVAGIHYLNRVILDDVGIIPLIGVCHVVASPAADSGATAWQCFLYGVDSKKCIAYIALHVLIGIGMAVLLTHVTVETSYLGNRSFSIKILILHRSPRR